MSLEEVMEMRENLDTDDVAQQRYIMYRIFDEALGIVHEGLEGEKPDPSDVVEQLKGSEGYIYKLSQDFLTSSSTLEKRETLDKILDFVERKYQS